MTMAEMRRGFRDQDEGLHWSYGRCHCGAWHQLCAGWAARRRHHVAQQQKAAGS